MYNERTQQQGACFRMGSMMPRQSMPMRDMPKHEMPNSLVPEGNMSRRRCDGSLRSTAPRQDSMPQGSCTGGGCGKWGLQGKPLAMVYSPCQSWQNAYAPETALERGTLFSELDLPFEGGKCRKGVM